MSFEDLFIETKLIFPFLKNFVCERFNKIQLFSFCIELRNIINFI